MTLKILHEGSGRPGIQTWVQLLNLTSLHSPQMKGTGAGGAEIPRNREKTAVIQTGGSQERWSRRDDLDLVLEAGVESYHVEKEGNSYSKRDLGSKRRKRDWHTLLFDSPTCVTLL
jgi:hypothetical protein